MQSSAAGARSDAVLTVPAGRFVFAAARAHALLLGAFAETLLTCAFRPDPITITPRILSAPALPAVTVTADRRSRADS